MKGKKLLLACSLLLPLAGQAVKPGYCREDKKCGCWLLHLRDSPTTSSCIEYIRCAGESGPPVPPPEGCLPHYLVRGIHTPPFPSLTPRYIDDLLPYYPGAGPPKPPAKPDIRALQWSIGLYEERLLELYVDDSVLGASGYLGSGNWTYAVAIWKLYSEARDAFDRAVAERLQVKP